jgi:hypothetical protein
MILDTAARTSPFGISQRKDFEADEGMAEMSKRFREHRREV